MGVANKAEITREMLVEYITHYNEWMKEITHYREQMEKMRPAASTARYGIEASMPRGGGNGHSDPTFVQATSQRVEPYIARRIAAVREVNRRKSHIRTVYENDVLSMWMDGLNNVRIAGELNVSEKTVRRYKERILDLMMEGK